MTDLHELYREFSRAAIHPTAVVPASAKVWDFARILADVVLGESVNVGGGTEIGRGSVIGDRSRISANVFLPPNSVIGSDVFIGPGVVCTDDRHPRCGNTDYTAEPPTIDDHAAIGAGAILLPGVRIGHHARVAAGAVVTKDVAPYEMVRGEPARVRPTPEPWSA